jgi:four helix bundle protein
MLRSYRDLKVWQKAMDLVVEVYRVSRTFPEDEQYGLTSQARRAAVSIPTNLAEGHGRFYRRDFVRHLSFANGSLTELETAIELGLRLRYITTGTAVELQQHSSEVGRMLAGLARRLRAEPKGRPAT